MKKKFEPKYSNGIDFTDIDGKYIYYSGKYMVTEHSSKVVSNGGDSYQIVTITYVRKLEGEEAEVEEPNEEENDES